MKMENRFKRLVPREVREKIAGWENKGEKPRMYLAAHIQGFGKVKDGEVQRSNANIWKELEPFFDVFLPQVDNPYGVLDSKGHGWEMALVDAIQIRHADVVLAVGGFGKDTSWECGFATALEKFSVLYLPNEEVTAQHIHDWMLHLTFAAILAPATIIGMCKTSVAISPDVKLIPIGTQESLGRILFELYEKEFKKCI